MRDKTARVIQNLREVDDYEHYHRKNKRRINQYFVISVQRRFFESNHGSMAPRPKNMATSFHLPMKLAMALVKRPKDMKPGPPYDPDQVEKTSD